MLGFRLSIQDNDSYAFRLPPRSKDGMPWDALHHGIVADFSGPVLAEHRRCERCGELLDKWNEPLVGLVIKKRKYDISVTYDGVVAVSQRFKSVYDQSGLSGLQFEPLPNDPEFLKIWPSKSVRFDAEKRKTRFEKRCPACGRFESIVGATPVYLVEGESLPDKGFVRTDLEFASGDEKHPLILCGNLAGRILKDAHLKGVDLVACE